MRDQKEFDLLQDVAALLIKYGPETFETLATSLKSPEFSQVLAEVLDSAAQNSRSTSAAYSGTRNRDTLRSIRQELDDLQSVEPSKHVILMEFYKALQEKRALPTLRDLNDFVEKSGLPVESSNKRPQAIARTIRFLLDLPETDIVQILDRAPTAPRSDNTLQGWSEIILDKGSDKATHRN